MYTHAYMRTGLTLRIPNLEKESDFSIETPIRFGWKDTVEGTAAREGSSTNQRAGKQKKQPHSDLWICCVKQESVFCINHLIS